MLLSFLRNLAPPGLIPSQLTSKPSFNFTYNNVSVRAANVVKMNQLTSCNHPLRYFTEQAVISLSQ